VIVIVSDQESAVVKNLGLENVGACDRKSNKYVIVRPLSTVE